MRPFVFTLHYCKASEWTRSCGPSIIHPDTDVRWAGFALLVSIVTTTARMWVYIDGPRQRRLKTSIAKVLCGVCVCSPCACKVILPSELSTRINTLCCCGSKEFAGTSFHCARSSTVEYQSMQLYGDVHDHQEEHLGAISSILHTICMMYIYIYIYIFFSFSHNIAVNFNRCDSQRRFKPFRICGKVAGQACGE